MKGQTNAKLASKGIPGESVNITLLTNQENHLDLIGAVITVSYGGVDAEYVWEGSEVTVKIPAMVDYSISVSEVEGYATPEGFSATSQMGYSRKLEMTYQCELVTVNVSAEEGEVSEYEVQIGTNTHSIEQVHTGYTQVEYIQSNGSQYIDTGINSNPNIRVWMDFALTDPSVANQRLFGMDVGNGDSSLLAFCFYSNSSNKLSFACQNGTGSGVNTGLTADTNRRIVDMDSYNSTFKIDDGTTYSTTMTGTRTTTSVYPMYLFCENRNGTSPLNYARMKLYGCKIYERDILVRDYVPVIDANNTAGLFDRVENKFYSNKTSNAFLVGSTIGELVEEELTTTFKLLYTQTTTTSTHKLPYNTEYIVRASSMSGYTTPFEQSFTASQPSRNVDVVYGLSRRGIFIQDIYGRLHTQDEWDGTQIANGVAVLTNECEFVMALNWDRGSSGIAWGGGYTDIPELNNFSSAGTAATDLDGITNTAKIISAIGTTNDGHRNGTVAADCSAFLFPNGKNGYLGSAGEWSAVINNLTEIENILTLLSGVRLGTYYTYWTSTEYDYQQVWVAKGSGYSNSQYTDYDLQIDYKRGNYIYRPFTPYIANPKIISFTLYSYSKTIQCQAWDGTGHEQWERSAFNTTGKTGDDLHTFMGGWGTEWAAAEVLEDGKTYYFVEPL